MKVLYFTKYSRQGASSRLRSYQYFPYLENEGIKVTVKPLFNDYYLNMLYQGKKTKFIIFKSYLNRFFSLFTIFQFDKVVIEKELFPYFFSFFEVLLSILGVSYIVDYDDAIFHNYDKCRNPIIRLFLSKKIDYVMRFSGCVVAGNSYLSSRAKRAGAKKIVLVPTVIDLDRYPLCLKSSTDFTVIGWVGSPSTYKYFQQLQPVLEQLAQQFPVCYHIVGAKPLRETINCFEFIPWSEATEVKDISSFDVGIMPLANTPWELGKCSYKLIQYMGCSLPVVASPVGMNTEVVSEEFNGYLASSDEEWFDSIKALIINKAIQNAMGLNGRKRVEDLYCLHKSSRVLIEQVLNKS
jgi:glycosyltransferase involved in cell wall biosynthesis